ncbi:hypothetical protein V6N13_034973 [Hibiscus sabdariffa]|uniref:Uncharacterized protein n=1 Tax=Hibiscus sabdariffa TaxID=183260 RepID=A0ABR2AYK4_9ROSI
MEFDSTGDLFGYPGRLSHSVESGAGRRRVFAVGNYVNQRLLRPLHNWLMEALGDLKTDGTFNQSAPLDRLVGAKKIYSIDLKAATDRWPLLIQLDLLKSLFGHEFADEVGNLLGFTMVSSRYQQILDSLGVIVSKDKTLVSDSGCGEFAKKFRTHGLTKDFSPVSFRNVMNSHHLLRIPYHFIFGLAPINPYLRAHLIDLLRKSKAQLEIFFRFFLFFPPTDDSLVQYC